MYRPSVALKYLDSYLGKCLIVNPRYTIRLTCLLATTVSGAHLLAETSLNWLFAGEWDSKTLKNIDFGPPQAKKYRNFGDFVSKKIGILTMLVINPPLFRNI